ncbi:MAG: cell division protein FtsZ [Candidatus Aminicenantia bacterium]
MEERENILKFMLAEEQFKPIKVKVMGIGGGGGNAINNLKEERIEDVEFIAINTDYQDLVETNADLRYQIGKKLTKGQGAGSDPEVGMKAAEEDEEKLKELIQDSDILFLTCCLGGGTGSGATPFIARLASELDILTIVVTIKPLKSEGIEKAKIAEDALRKLRTKADVLVPISNQRLVEFNPDKALTIEEAFKLADSVLIKAVKGITEIIKRKKKVNVDLADLKTILKGRGIGIFGEGRGKDERRVFDALDSALNNPLYKGLNFSGYKAGLLNIKCKNLKMQELDQIISSIRANAEPTAKFKYGLIEEPTFDDEIEIFVVIAGFDEEIEERIITSDMDLGIPSQRVIPISTPFDFTPVFPPSTLQTPPTPSTPHNLYEPAFMRKKKEKLVRNRYEKN